MSQPALQPMSLGDFFSWQEKQDVRYELVGGVPSRMMVGVTNQHDRIVVNLIVALSTRFRGTGCVPFTGESAMETYPGQIRRPDVGVDCGPRDPAAYKAAEPRLVVEVLSPSTRDFDTIEKLAEYRSVATLDMILYVEPNWPEVIVWSRAEDRSWIKSHVEDAAATIDIPALGVGLPLAEIYDGVEFTNVPRLAFDRARRDRS